MTTSCTDHDHPYYDQLKSLGSREVVKFFTNNKGARMRYVSLGEALDFASWGFMNGVAYDLSPRAMVWFIRKWMSAQKPRRKIVEVPTKIKGVNEIREDVSRREYGYLWNRFHEDFPEQLPRIDYKKCPRDSKHQGTIEDRGGLVRCAHIDKRLLVPSFVETTTFFDPLSGLEQTALYENCPHDPSWIDEKREIQCDEDEWREYLANLQRHREETPKEFSLPCYAVIREPVDTSLPLQVVLNRLNIAKHGGSYSSRKKRPKKYGNPFSGFTLANFVKAWWEQPGKKINLWKRQNRLFSLP